MRIWLLLSCVALFTGGVLTAQNAPMPAKKSTKAGTKRPATIARKSTAKSMNAPRRTGSPGQKPIQRKSLAASNQKRRAPATSKKVKSAPSHHAAQLQPTPDRYKEIQEALANRGYFNGSPDGTWGPESVDALKRFQRDQNLTDDGKIGSLSLIALGLGPKRGAVDTSTDNKVQQ